MSSNKKENKNGSKKSARILAGLLAVAMLFGSAVTVFQAFFAGKNNGGSTASNFNTPPQQTTATAIARYKMVML